MQTKLTLRLDSEVIERAKAHASRSGRSLSQLVADYFELLDTQRSEAADVPGTVRDLHGCLAGARPTRARRQPRAAERDADFAAEAVYDDYREAKYGAGARAPLPARKGHAR